jgi:hypothetical protein
VQFFGFPFKTYMANNSFSSKTVPACEKCADYLRFLQQQLLSTTAEIESAESSPDSNDRMNVQSVVQRATTLPEIPQRSTPNSVPQPREPGSLDSPGRQSTTRRTDRDGDARSYETGKCCLIWMNFVTQTKKHAEFKTCKSGDLRHFQDGHRRQLVK